MKKRVVVTMLAMMVAANMLAGCGSTKLGEATASTNYQSSTEEYLCTEEAVCSDYVADTFQSSAYSSSNAQVRGDVAASNGNSEYEIAEYESAKRVVNQSDCVNEWYDFEDEWYEDEYIEKTYSPIDRENYTKIVENDYIDVISNPLSTFAADVDTASYSNLRRMINDGLGLDMINPDAVRTEEIVNYFKYDYKEPKNGEVFGVESQISTCPWNKSAYLMTIGINTAMMDSEDIPDCNIVFLVDVSGSMSSSNKLPLIQKTMAMLVDNFDENDRISIVTYANGVNTVLDGCNGDKSRKIIKAFESLNAGGSTNGGDGIKTAYKIAEKNYIDGGVNRVIVCSDGDFNVGLTTKSELEELITNKKDSGIFLSTLGFGMGNYSDTTMETLADKGNGNYAYIDDLSEAKKVLVDEMTSTFVTVAKDVKLQVEFNPALVSKYRLVGYENRAMAARDFKDDTKDGGEMGAGHQVTVVYEIYKADENDDISLKYQDTKLSSKGVKGDEYCTLSVAYKEPDGKKSRYLEFPINADNFTTNPSVNYRLATALAQASLGLKNSEYLVDMSRNEALESSIKIVNNINRKYKDEYITEFAGLMTQVLNNI